MISSSLSLGPISARLPSVLILGTAVALFGYYLYIFDKYLPKSVITVFNWYYAGQRTLKKRWWLSEGWTGGSREVVGCGRQAAGECVPEFYISCKQERMGPVFDSG